MAGVLGNPLGFQGILFNGTDFNNITVNGYYLMVNSAEYLNYPCKEGALIVINVSYFFIQIVLGSQANGVYYRSKWGSSDMTTWYKIL